MTRRLAITAVALVLLPLLLSAPSWATDPEMASAISSSTLTEQVLAAAAVALVAGLGVITRRWVTKSTVDKAEAAAVAGPAPELVNLQLLGAAIEHQADACAGVTVRIDAYITADVKRREAAAREAGEMTTALQQAASQIARLQDGVDRLQSRVDALHSGQSR